MNSEPLDKLWALSLSKRLIPKNAVFGDVPYSYFKLP